MLDEHGLRLSDDGCPVSGRERRFDLDPAGRRDPRFTPLASHVRPLGILVGEQRTAHQRDAASAAARATASRPVGLSVGGLLDPAIDLVDVEPGCLERVSPGTMDQVLGAEHASQPRHEHAHLLSRLGWELEPPQHVGCPIHRDDLTARRRRAT